MKRKYLTKAIVVLAVLVLASSVPAMQGTFIAEYQPICPEESYNKITELHEEGWSEDEIAEELAFPLGIVNRYLEGNYIPPSCPELDQSIQPIPKESYNKITELYDEGWSEEEIAEELAFPLDIVTRYLKGNYTYVKTSSTYDEPPGMKEYVPPKEPLPRPTPPVEQDRSIMTQGQESPAQSNASLNPEDYDRTLLHDFLSGKIDRIPGAKDYVPPPNEELLPRPTPPVEQDRLIMAQDRETSVEPMSAGIAAGYQFFKGGRVGAYTDTITNLKPEVKEWQVLHQWPTQGENCIVITYDPENEPNTGVFGIYISAFDPDPYRDYVHYPASHEIIVAIRPEHENGHTDYTQITFLVYDQTEGVQWSKTYTLPDEQNIKDVDGALEHNDTVTPNSIWKTFFDYHALEKNLEGVNLKDTFEWKQHPSPNMTNEHSEYYYGGDEYARLNQRKTPGGGYLITSKSGTLSGTGNSYTFSVSDYSTVTVVMAGNENADFDLYAKWGSPPTTSSYDARGYSGTSLEYFTTSGSGTLYIMVRSWSGSGHWKCWALWGDPSADSGRKRGTLSKTGDTATYSLSGSAIGYAFNSGPDGSDFDLYTKWNSPPTTSDYDARGYSGWAQEIAGPASGPPPSASGTLYFMVRSWYGSGDYATATLIF